MLLNRDTAKEQLVHEDFFAGSHGVIAENGFLGTSLLYFSLAYLLPAQVAVILGSGGGFVPRLVRQAQREVPDKGFVEKSRCILIDAGLEVKDFGVSDYHGAPAHFLHAAYPDIEIWKMTTDEAAERLKKENLPIDFLHIDADHTYSQSLKDFENYLPLMREEFTITLHDTALDHLEGRHDGCVARTVAYLRKEMLPGGRYEHLEMINFNRRNRVPSNFFQEKLCCKGTAIIKPKSLSFWDTVLTEAPWLVGTT